MTRLVTACLIPWWAVTAVTAYTMAWWLYGT